MTGWQCPGCKSCYAPSVTECHRCPPEDPVAAQARPRGPIMFGGVQIGGGTQMVAYPFGTPASTEHAVALRLVR